MPLNIKNRDVERLANEVAELTGESKTEAIRRALEERRSRLALRLSRKSKEDVIEVLERYIWAEVPKPLRGRTLSRRKWEQILGYGREGA